MKEKSLNPNKRFKFGLFISFIFLNFLDLVSTLLCFSLNSDKVAEQNPVMLYLFTHHSLWLFAALKLIMGTLAGYYLYYITMHNKHELIKSIYTGVFTALVLVYIWVVIGNFYMFFLYR